MSDKNEMIAAITSFLEDDEMIGQFTQDTFENFDNDGSGQLDKKEIVACIEYLADMANIPKPSSKDIGDIMKDIDSNSNSKVDLDEFRQLVVSIFTAIKEGLE